VAASLMVPASISLQSSTISHVMFPAMRVHASHSGGRSHALRAVVGLGGLSVEGEL
jgi:hypothetical protein